MKLSNTELSKEGKFHYDKLRRQGFEVDELDTLFATEQEMLEYVASVSSLAAKDRQNQEKPGSVASLTPDDDDDLGKDSFELGEHETEEMLLHKKRRKFKAAAPKPKPAPAPKEPSAADPDAPAEAPDPEVEVEAPEEEEPESELSYEDFLKSLEEGMTADDSDVPNN